MISDGKKISQIKQEAIDSKKPKPINEEQAMALYIGEMQTTAASGDLPPLDDQS